MALYHPTSFLRDDLPDEIRAGYENKILGGFTQEGRERILIAMMKVNFLKRLESSVDSFCLTLKRTIDKIDGLEERIARFEAHLDGDPELDYETLTPEKLEDPEFEEEDFVIGGRRRFHLAHLQLPEWLKAVRHDRAQLQYLLEKTASITAARDGKLAELKAIIEAKVDEPTVNRDGKPNRKVLVFTAFADTAEYLYRNLVPWARAELGIHTGLVTGGTSGNEASLGQSDFDDILTNFAPLAKRRADQVARFPNQAEEIDLLIATDCISEGQNLQDCDLLVNYDIHWNPVRIIQRFGRIDRIGSRNEAVQLVNFWPVADLDHYLNLKHRVEARMALADVAATQTDNLLDTSQIEDLIEEDLLFRQRQLRRLQHEILDLEDLDDSVSLSDFSLDEFRLDLLRYLEANRAELEEAGEGLYAVVPPKGELFVSAQPGALFCLRHRPTADGTAQSKRTSTAERLNPLAPYYLVYVHDDGTVRYGFSQPKEAMALLRELAAGEPKAFERLCDQFDERTQDGADMSHYSGLLNRALASVERTFQKRAASSLLAGRGARLPTSSETPTSADDEFDLVTWLVIQRPD